MRVELAWWRSWPSDGDLAEIEPLRPRVVDKLPRLIMAGGNYATVGQYQTWPDDQPGFCMLEWDVALDPWERRYFAALALLDPRAVLVAPYRFGDTWITWANPETSPGGAGAGPSKLGRPLRPGVDEWADSFGLGCIYFPRAVLLEFLEVMDHFGFSDGTFGAWYRDKYGPARVTWAVHPQHLHEYDQKGIVDAR